MEKSKEDRPTFVEDDEFEEFEQEGGSPCMDSLKMSTLFMMMTSRDQPIDEHIDNDAKY